MLEGVKSQLEAATVVRVAMGEVFNGSLLQKVGRPDQVPSDVVDEVGPLLLVQRFVEEDTHLREVVFVAGVVTLGVASEGDVRLQVSLVMFRTAERIGEIVWRAVLVVA